MHVRDMANFWGIPSTSGGNDYQFIMSKPPLDLFPKLIFLHTASEGDGEGK
jgi:hypothetical protein